jgi:Brp/Blh family beta-carotene 15,15'-monooxygenase
MVNSEKYKILITLICMLLGVFVPTSILWVVAAINVLTIGVIHGANDLYILSKTIKSSPKRSFSSLFFIYTGFVLLMVIALFQFPQWAVLLFVMASAFHFGEQHWYQKSHFPSVKLHFFYAAYGLFIFALLFYTHLDQTTTVIFDITTVHVSFSFFLFLLIGAATLTLALLLLNLKQLSKQLFFQTLALFVLVLLFSQTSLLWSFSVYFVLWHSIPSLQEQALVLYPNKPKPIVHYIRLASPYWLLSLLGFAAALYFFSDDTQSLLALFFSFLAAITIPHVGVIFWMHQKN